MADGTRRTRHTLVLITTLLWSLVSLDLGPAHAQVGQPGDPRPTPDPVRAAQAARDAGAQQSNGVAPKPAVAAEGAQTAAEAVDPSRFVTYRVFATQYEPNTPGAVEVALPDRCVKFAALRNTSALAGANCGSGYPLDLDYRVSLVLDNGRTAAVPVREVGPWNLDDNYWNPPSGSPRPRRRFTDLPTGTPESQAAFYNGYNVVSNCGDLDERPTGRSGGADQFGRCVLNPAGLDLSVAAAAQLGLGNLENAWVTVSFLWEPANATYVPVTPARILDTRVGTGAPNAPLGPDRTIDLTVVGAGGVPVSNVSAVVLNVTATDMVGPETFLTVFPTGSPRPVASTLNLTEGRTVPNLVVALVGAGGKVSIYNHVGNVAVIADVQGWYAASGTTGGRYTPVTPARVFDTRDGTGRSGAVGQVPAGGTIELNLAGAGGVPSSAVSTVMLNVTATDLRGPDTHVDVFPSGEPRPATSNLNVTSGESVANLVMAKVTDGRIMLFNNAGSVDLVADVQGWFGPGAATTYASTAPVRDLDTRTGDGGTSGRVGPDSTIELTVAGVNGVPSGIRAIVLNVTVTEHIGPESYLTVHPSGGGRPISSNLNFVAGQTRANLVTTPVGSNGVVSIYNHVGNVHIVADVQGWFP